MHVDRSPDRNPEINTLRAAYSGIVFNHSLCSLRSELTSYGAAGGGGAHQDIGAAHGDDRKDQTALLSV